MQEVPVWTYLLGQFLLFNYVIFPRVISCVICRAFAFAAVNILMNGFILLGPCVGRLFYIYDIFLLEISLVYFVGFEV